MWTIILAIPAWVWLKMLYGTPRGKLLFWDLLDFAKPWKWSELLTTGFGSRYGARVIFGALTPNQVFVYSFIISYFLWQVGLTFVSLIFMFISFCNIAPQTTTSRRIFWGILCIPAMLYPTPDIIMFNAWFVFMWEVEVLPFKIVDIINNCEEIVMSHLDITHLSPLIRNSETGWLQPWLDTFMDCYDAIVWRFSGKVKVDFLRPIEITEGKRFYPGLPRIEVDTLEEKVAAAVKVMKYMYYLALGSVMFISLLNSNGITLLAGFIFLFCIAELNLTNTDYGAPKINMKSGCYRVRRGIYGGLDVGKGIGFVYRGVMHIPYHVCYGAPIQIRGAEITPYFVSKNLDIVTYGGPSQLEDFYDGEMIYVLLQEDETQVTCQTKAKVSDGTLIYHAVSRKGQSGSPIAVVRNGQVLIVGITGNVLKTRQEDVEYHRAPPKLRMPAVEIPEQNVVNYVTQHPGAGKTHNFTPMLVSELLKAGRKKILVTGPTRVVCNEIQLSLKQSIKDETISVVVKGSLHRSVRARVQVMAHATAVSILLKEDPILRDLDTVIIDESHTDDLSTKLLEIFCLTHEIPVYLMSATHPHEMDDNSNYPIEDIQIRESEVCNFVVEEITNQDRRVLLFVPSVDGKKGVMAYAKLLASYNPILMYRANYEQAKIQLCDVTRKLIISTNIAECGLNADIDTVIDTSRVYIQTYVGGISTGAIQQTTQANRIQRRGRVGRNKPGRYYYIDYPTKKIEDDTLACNQAEEIASILGWKSGPRSIPITRKQLIRMYEKNLTMLGAWFEYEATGLMSSREQKDAKFKELTSGDINIEKCPKNTGSRTCTCTTLRYKWWDDALHDKITSYLAKGRGVT